MKCGMNPMRPPENDEPALLERLRHAAELLELIDANRGLLDQLPAEDRQRLHRAVAQLYDSDPVARRRKQKAAERARSGAQTQRADAVLHETGIRALRRKPVFTTPNVFAPKEFKHGEESPELQHCYVCKQKYSVIHHFYDQMCPAVRRIQLHAKRTELADLTGRVALLTGGRVKIGYQAGFKLLRAGAQLIVTTRFPRDSAKRYAQEPDFSQWGHRLEIFGLDMRHTPSVEAFCRELLATRSRLDFIINNACQTVRRPPDFYAHMMEGERVALRGAPDSACKLLGTYEGLRSYDMLAEANSAAVQAASGGSPSEAAGLTRAAELSKGHLFPEELLGHCSEGRT